MDSARRLLVLLVEDEAAIRDLIGDALEDGGFDVVLASNASEASEQIAEHGMRLCALVTDINLGRGPSGWAVATLARASAPEIAVVYISGDSSHEWRRLGVGDSTMLPKPFSPAQVVVALSAQLKPSGAD